MLNLPPDSNFDLNNYPSEIIDRDLDHRHSLPRHISRLTSKAHSSQERLAMANRFQQHRASKNYNRSLATALAVNISRYQLSDRALIQKHSQNVRSSLEHRLQVAVEQENSQLIALLQTELKQLQTSVQIK